MIVATSEMWDRGHRLRAEGLTYAEVALQLEMSPKGAYDALHNPRPRYATTLRGSGGTLLIALMERTGEPMPDTGCRHWQMSAYPNGYGQVAALGRHWSSHRLVCLLNHGLDPLEVHSDRIVRHTCDNPICCNPRHLVLGSHRDNAKDKADRGRENYALGESNGSARLKARDIPIIIDMVRAGDSLAAVARFYRVSPDTISKVVKRITWKHIETKESI